MQKTKWKQNETKDAKDFVQQWKTKICTIEQSKRHCNNQDAAKHSRHTKEYNITVFVHVIKNTI